MITIEPTSDKEYIKDAMFAPGILDNMIDDSFPENYKELIALGLDNSDGFFLKVLVDGVGAGWFWFRPVNDTLESHSTLLGNCRGRKAILAAKKAIKWVFKHTNFKSISCSVFSDMPYVSWFCRTIGFTKTSVNPWPNTKKGKEVSVYNFTIERTK